MQEEITKNISQFLDDELDQQQALSLLKTIRQDNELKNKMARFQAISQVLKAEDCVVAQVDLVDNVRKKIKQEPVYFIPQKRGNVITWQKTSLAIAASFAIVAVLAPKLFKHSGKSNANQIVVAEKQVQSIKSLNQQYIPVQQYQVNRRLNDYLQAHSNSVYTIGASNYQSYARVAGYSRER